MKKRIITVNHALKNHLITFSSNQLKDSPSPSCSTFMFHEVSLTLELKAIQKKLNKKN